MLLRILISFMPETLLKDPNPCDSNPCQHDSTCHREDAPDKVTCICLPDFSGKLCQFSKDIFTTSSLTKTNCFSCAKITKRGHESS